MYIQMTPLGRVGISEVEEILTALNFDPPVGMRGESSPILREAFAQLNAYLEGRLAFFSLPLAPATTVFQGAFRENLLAVPYGGTVSYQGLACKMGASAACRAVGNACSRNSLPIFIPCHRVVGRSRPLLYRGGEARKRFLLELEQRCAGS